MLIRLSVRNLAIIDHLDIEFYPGFNVLTGETGAGKSILIDALGLALGARADPTMVRAGADKAVVDALFDLSRLPHIAAIAQEMGFEPEESLLLLSREIQSNGRSLCRIAGRPATVAQLKTLAEWLIDLHGQHEHQSLLSQSRHRDILDEWGGQPILEAKSALAVTWTELQNLRQERQALEKEARERMQLLDLYQFQIREIDSAKLVVGEDEELAAEHRRVANAQRLAENVTAALLGLSNEDTGGAIETLDRVERALAEAASFDERLNALLETVRSALYELSEVERELGRYQENIEFSPERLQAIEERLELLRTLKRKYGATIEEILQYRDDTERRLHALTHSEERSRDLDQAIARLEARLSEQCERLSSLRRAAAEEFQKLIQQELQELGMERARFQVELQATEPSMQGADRVEFLLSTNPGEPLRPLVKVASGGEISRVMLAVKTAMSLRQELPTMVFDEIDVGIGGRTASVIAAKMAALAKRAQLLCITHLAPIASRAEHQFAIEKRVRGERTTVQVTPLTSEQRIEEIARMLGGNAVTDTVRQHAREMLASQLS
ncbi:DNA replication and repair protein RecN [Chthonomonas calidirosea]|uniref:DNA repair protein RecN n=1 Tax=Chthonomonas calidirosea TaxID=454171 RepID=UPI0006DD43FB|nr:DNA repair protein RecN [Chthonomonas calidirosea]CEK19535.1 DNA replication and repair protein RecN [Chthonomonas calidirosea]